ncbi:hypothetical protein [Wenxinia saemankumensis]|uniref:Peptidase propeptide and YPEB domain-containing protein n=1 Tax=Wenxinia saemankumensis TaxID=1447782 RepID=A0A1M6EN77_9RHOB|nr:hypothetical protein [Wenxinia saemankumensis]SHI86700.1 hypothetical protein SAMN05444417_2075 [Wenxinia saemankumensis]
MSRPTRALLFALASLAAPPALAQSPGPACAPHRIVVERLADRFGESRQSIALGSDNTVVEVFASLESGTWTITVTRPGGPTCLVASGLAYEPVTDPLPNTDPPA